ncbi:MAG: leucine-rich repeat protein [Clostridia bacterium]|nr:leucine-rich repeat protein [Clostridia bacterium]
MDGRLNTRDCFFAVKKDVDKIKREDFQEPKKDDAYSTSVLGIQFNRAGMCTAQIISRYNHTVPNPNCTLGNNLDNIAPGLKQSFANLLLERGLKLNTYSNKNFEIPGYTVANDGKYYKYNMEINGNYYCPGNIVISGGEVISVANPEEGLLIDYFYIDKNAKTIETCANITDSFVDDLKGIEKIEVVKSDEENVNRTIKIYIKDIEEPVLIGIDKDNKIVKYENNNITNIENKFLYGNKGLNQLELPNLKQVGTNFLNYNNRLTRLKLPNLEQAGDDFLYHNKGLTQLELPKLKHVGYCFLYLNKKLNKLYLPELKQVGDEFLCYNKELVQLELPKLQHVGDSFLYHNEKLNQIELPELKQVGDGFLDHNKELVQLELPKLQYVGEWFLYDNEKLNQLELPKLNRLGKYFLHKNKNLPKILEAKNLMLITSRSIAELDKNNRLTTSEITMAHKIIEKIKSLFKKKDRNER